MVVCICLNLYYSVNWKCIECSRSSHWFNRDVDCICVEHDIEDVNKIRTNNNAQKNLLSVKNSFITKFFKMKE